LLVDPRPFIDALVGKVVAHVWRGHGSAMFIEFGQLTPTKRSNGTNGNPEGELTLMIEWSWRIERPQSILGGSWSSGGKWPGMFKQIVGATVESVEIFGRLPEISIGLSNGLHVVSFMTAEGQPQWTVLTRKPFIGHLSVKRGRLAID
jgi:hypothetical protein